MLDVGAEQRVLLNPCDWATYESLQRQHADRSAPRFTYSDGMLEIMSPSPEHEELTGVLETIVFVVAEELGLQLRILRSTTQRRVELQKGAEPDASYFIGSTRRDPATEPPDLVIEVEISRSAIDKLPIFAGLNVPEVWRCQPDTVEFLNLQKGSYQRVSRSAFFPLTADGLSRQLAAWRATEDWTEWVRNLRSWVRGLRVGEVE